MCQIDGAAALISWTAASLVLPNEPHLSPQDGGHLIVVPTRHVGRRREFELDEVLAVHKLAVLAAGALEEVGWADWINFQENGNWSVDSAAGVHAHLHVYGRSRGSTTHPFGEPLMLPTRAGLAERPVPLLTKEERRVLSDAISKLLR